MGEFAFTKRPEHVGPQQLTSPSADIRNDPAFALRREEFEQWLARRKETLEDDFAKRKAELEKGFEDKVKERVKKAPPVAVDWENDPRTARLKQANADLRAKNIRLTKHFEERLEAKTGAMPRATFAALVNCLHTDREEMPSKKQRDEALGLLTQWKQKYDRSKG